MIVGEDTMMVVVPETGRPVSQFPRYLRSPRLGKKAATCRRTPQRAGRAQSERGRPRPQQRAIVAATLLVSKVSVMVQNFQRS